MSWIDDLEDWKDNDIPTDWDEFFEPFRDDTPAPPELLELAEKIQELNDHNPNMIDPSNNVCVVIDSDQWNDIMDFLSYFNMFPKCIVMSPMHADPKEMDNKINS